MAEELENKNKYRKKGRNSNICNPTPSEKRMITLRYHYTLGNDVSLYTYIIYKNMYVDM